MSAGTHTGERPPKPTYPPFVGLPDLPAIRDLKGQDRWVSWGYFWKEDRGKWDKPPLDPKTGRNGSSTDPRTWAPYAQAEHRAMADGLPGVGYVLSRDGAESGIDLDGCRDPETGKLQAWAQQAVDFRETYTEVSPSGRGLRFFVKGKVEGRKNDAAQVEIYADGRYLTVTGQHVPGTPTEICEAPETVRYLHERADQFKEMQRAAAEAARETERKRQEKAGAKQAEQPKAASQEQARQAAGGRIRGAFGGSEEREPFWRNVNARALSNLPAWVPVLFPSAVWQGGTSGYRVTQRDLGEAYQEDLSIHPDGIVDFGVADMGDRRDGKRTPIDLVQEHGGAGSAADAAQWLCDRLGIDSESLGWRGRKARSGASQRGRDDNQAGGEPKSDDAGELPIVQLVGGEIPRVVREAEAVILKAGSAIYSRAGSLVRPVIDDVPASGGRMTTVARFRSLCVASLADHTARVMRFQRYDGRVKDWVTVNPPSEVMTAMLTREGEWSLPPVAGIITTPTLRSDGSILSQTGYDPATRLYLHLDPTLRMPDVPERPSRDDAETALSLIEDLLSGFPFVAPVDKAVALSGIMTAVVRGTIPVAPLHAIRAHSPGTGKSFLVDIAATIATGRRCPVIAAGKTEEETEKRLGALLRDAVPVVSIDNVNGELGGDMLCQLTERPLIRVRILGKSEAPELECRSTTFATGNNMVLVGDMTRRTVLCTLDAGVERPELRAFAFDPLERVHAERGAYVAAVLTIVRAYRTAGSPNVCGPIGSYGGWSDAVRAPLIWLGQADPVASMDTAREEDPELTAIRELFGHWRETLSMASGYTANAIAKTACEKGPGTSYDYNVQEFRVPEFRDLLLRQAGDGPAVSTRRLGKWLARISGRVVDDHRIEMRADGSNGSRFSLCRIASAEPTGREAQF